MKKLYTTLTALLVNTIVFAQSFTISGPQTIFNVNAYNPTATVSGAVSTTGANFTLFNFETGKTVPGTSFESEDWHIGFYTNSVGTVLRTILNGGGSGPGNVQGYVANGTAFESYTSVPGIAVFTIDGWAANGSNKVTTWTSSTSRLSQYNAASSITGIVPGSVFAAHTVTPVVNRLLIIKLANGKYVKFELISNYKNAPTSLNYSFNTQDDLSSYGNDYGYVSFRYLLSGSDDLSENITRVNNLSATLTNNQLFDLPSADSVALADSASGNWTLGFKTTSIILNGGTKGPGTTTGTVLTSGFNDVTDVASLTGLSLVSDNAIVSGSGNGWYNYDFNTHTIQALTDRTILIQTTNGRYAKLVVHSYYKNNPDVLCGDTRYYTFSYYFNPYGTTDLSKTVTLPAEPALPSLAVSSVGTVTATGGLETVTVTSNVSWSAATTDNWLTISSVAGNSLEIAYAPNTVTGRTGYITVTGCNLVQVLSVVQEGTTTTITGIDNGFGATGISLYPNPATEAVNISSTVATIGFIQITDLTGKAIAILPGEGNNATLSLSGFQPGIYVVKVLTSKGQYVQKLTVQ